MNASNFIYLICWLVQNSQQPMSGEDIYQQLTNRLWPNTKIRMQRWKEKFSHFETNLPTDLHKRDDAENPQWQSFLSLVDEIILAESLTRVLFAVITSRTDCPDVRDIAADVVADNQDIRRRIYSVLAQAPAIVEPMINQACELKVLNEHITDLMLSQLPNRQIARSFAINTNAFDEFVKCAGPYQEEIIRQANVALGLAFSTGIQNLANPIEYNEDINQKIADDIAELFDPASLENFPTRCELVEV